MEEDSRHFLKSDQMTHSQTVSQQSNSQSQTFHCNYCVLIFKSKYFLREHVKRVHGFDVDSSQVEGNSTTSTTATEPNTNRSLYNDNLGELFTCRHCVFTSSSRTVIDKHEKAYHKVLSSKGVSVQQTNTVTGMWALQCNQVGVEKVSSSKSMSTSDTKSIPNASLLLKNLQTNKGSSGNISKIRVASGSPLESSQMKLPNLAGPPRLANKPTLTSQRSLSKSVRDNDEGLSKVTEQSHTESEQRNTHCCSLCNFSAISLMDLRSHQQQKHRYLYSMCAGFGPSSTEQQEPKMSGGSLKGPLFNKSTKRTNNDIPLSPAKKKLKVDIKTRSPQSIVVKSKLSSFNFEVSEDDPDKSFSGTEKDEDAHLVNGESSGNPRRLYFCKHCDYSHKSSRSVSTHYQRVHPYIRYNFRYILDTDDKSATFRCLHCPVEFSTSDDLKKHHKDQHPGAPNVFMMRSDQLNLVYKCFACQFTTPVSRFLKIHYSKEHPSFQMNNSLMYCSYIATHPQEPLSQTQTSGQTSGPSKAGIISPERSQTSRNETSNDEDLYHCKHCMFSNKSVIAMLVHYQKKHPKAGVTIDKIKQASFATSSKKLKEESPQKVVLEPFKPQEVTFLNTPLPTSDVVQNDVEHFFFCQQCNYSNVTVRGVLNHQRKRHSDLKATVEHIHIYTAEVRSRSKKSVGKDTPDTSLQNDFAQEEAERLFYCQFCNYGNPTVKGILNHLKLRHSHKSTAEQILKHTAEVSKHSKKPQPTVDNSPNTTIIRPEIENEVDGLFFCQYCNYGDPTVKGVLSHQRLRHSDLEATANKILKYSAEVHGENEAEGTPNSSLLTSNVDKDIDKLFFCQHCNYGNPSVRGVLNHQRKRHSDLKATFEQIFKHTALLRAQTGKSLCTDVDSPNTSQVLPLPLMEENTESMLFCHLCNYGNPTVRGVLNHQRKRHPKHKSSAKQVFKYTAVVHNQTGKSQLIKVDSPKSSPLKPDVSQEDDKHFFCQLCDYGNPTVRGILNHQKLRHCDLKATADQVVQYTAIVCGQSEKPQTSQPDLSSITVPFSDSERDSQPRVLKCHKCTYTTPHVYLLKRHLWNKHQVKATVISIIRSAYRDGILETGYHCEWCVSIHPEANGLFQHYLEHHPWRKSSVEYITSTLHAGPKRKSKKQKAQSEHNVKNENISLQLGEGPKTSPFQLTGRSETKLYPCRACPFKGSTIESIKSHYRAVHPWSVKEDGSVLDVISSRRLTENRQIVEADVHNTILGSFDSQKHPLDIPGQLKETVSERLPLKTSTSSKHYTCPVCSTKFNTMHGVYTHCGKKHPEYKDDRSIFENENDNEPSTSEATPVNKCPVCPYVNSRIHGVLTHCQMKHPAFKARAENLEKEIVQFPSVEGCDIIRQRRPEGGIGGYRCKMCPVIYASWKKLKIHYERHHNQTAASMFKSAPKQSTLLKKQLLSKYRNTQGSIAQAAIFKKRKSVVFKCHLCKYCCTTKKSLDRHMNNSHNTPKTENKVFYYKCSLCSYSTSVCKYLAAHYRRCHSHAEYNAYFVSVFKRSSQKSSPEGFPSTSSDCQASPIKDIILAIEKRKCSLCFFQTSSEKDMATHYLTSHPVVPRSSQPYSKPGSNFSLHSTPKTVKTNRAEKQKKVSQLFEPQSENGIKCISVQCRKCTNLYFNTPLLLSIHYTHFHSKDFKQDFITLSSTSEGGTEFYRCGYCNLKIQGRKELCSHIDHHTGVFRKLANEEQSKTKAVKLERQELPEVLTTDELARWNVTKVQSFALGTSPQGSPSMSSEMAEAEKGSGEVDGFPCYQCGRSFMSLKGLRSHERSHAAMAALKRLGKWQDSISSTTFDQHITYRPGTVKPFHCGLCAYRTNFIGLIKNHLLKAHGAEYSDKNHTLTSSQDKESTQRPNEEASNPAEPQEGNGVTEHSQEAVLTEKPMYSEPPDVQRQLNHYRQIAQGKPSAPSAPQATMPTIEGLFSCEFCTFATGHIQSIRRHYLNRHNGKRLLRCKDCSFITGFRKKLDMHIDAGHSSSPTEVLKDLRCPLCLYHTKNKNNMIDHIVLHREERVAPIEVRRSKLSRYLQGIVFRCHKCTFTSSSDENLRLHMVKHDDIKPYKCRLCFFDCTQLRELEAHLCEKHHVMRNHELVGQVNLEQLEARLSKVNWEESKKCDTEPGNEDEETNNRCGKKPGQEEEQENTAEPINERPEEERNIVELTNVFDEKQSKKEDENIAEQIDELLEKPGQEKEENITKPFDVGQEGGENVAEQIGELHQKESQEKDDNLEDRNNELCEAQGQEEEEGITEPFNEGHDGEENIAEHHNELCKMQGQEGEVDKEETNNKKDVCQDHDTTTDRVAQDCDVHERYSEKQENNADVDVEEQSMDCEENQGHEEMEDEEGDQYHEMPVLENEYLKEETHRSHIERQEQTENIYQCNKNQEQVPIVEEEHEEKARRDENPENEGEEDGEENGGTSEPKDALTTPKLIPMSSNEKLFACELCGRTFINNTELERHVMRHGM